MINNERFDTPIVLMIFNRPECTQKVFDKIRLVQPKELFIIADGPRSDNDTDVVSCRAARAVVDKIDWPCEVHRNFSDKNLGCGRRPATGLDWVFTQVEEAIILEDDCVPDASFFPFCQELLSKYRDDTRVVSISGNNYQKSLGSSDSYYFSAIPQTWGWATWKRVWCKYDYTMKLWPMFRQENILKQIFYNERFADMWEKIFDQVYDGTISSAWDYQFVFLSFLNQGMNILPKKNLVKYIGLGDQATHTAVMDNVLLQFVGKSSVIDFPLKHPQIMRNNYKADCQDMVTVFGVESTFSKELLLRIRHMYNRCWNRFSNIFGDKRNE